MVMFALVDEAISPCPFSKRVMIWTTMINLFEEGDLLLKGACAPFSGNPSGRGHLIETLSSLQL